MKFPSFKIMRYIFIIIINLVGLSINAQTTTTNNVTPYTQGDTEWIKYSNPSERVKALQIPTETIGNISTMDLLTLCLDYPYLTDMLFCESIQEGMRNLIKSYNGFNELLKRSDFFECGIKKGIEIFDDIMETPKKDSIQIGQMSFKNFVLEYLMSSCSFFNSDYIEKLNNYSAERNKIKEKYPYFFGNLNDVSFANLHNLLKSNKDTIIEKTRNLSTDWEPAIIRTPNGSIVPDTYYYVGTDISLTQYQLATLANEIYLNYNGAQLIGAPTYKYNCHGYAWHVSEGGNYVWIGRYYDTSEDIYWLDNSYFSVDEQQATKVSYSGNHSAIRLDSIWYQSKWGYGPLVKHYLNEVPAIYAPSSTKNFYLRTPSINGPNQFCNNATYSIENLPAGATVQWSTGIYISIVSGQGTGTLSVEKLYDGLGDITASIILGGNVIKTLSKYDIGVGNPPLSQMVYPLGPNGSLTWDFTQAYNTFIVEDVINQFYSYYQLYLYKQDGNNWTQVAYCPFATSEITYIPYFGTNGWYKMMIRGYGDCGYSDWWELEVLSSDLGVNNNWDFTLDYQPSADNLVIRIHAEKGSTEAFSKKENNDDYIIQLWTESQLVKTVKTKSTECQLSVCDMNNGVYVVRVLKNGQSYSKKFVKKQ